MALGAQRFPFRATAAQPGRLEAGVESGGAAFPFTADLSDDIVTLATGGGIDFNRTASCGMNWACDRYDASTGTFHDRDDR